MATVEHHIAPGADGAGIVVRVYAPATDGAHRPGIVFLHGGGWVIGDLDSHDGVCRRICNGVDAVVVAVHYRRAPEHKFPAAADDAYDALTWAAANAPDLGIDETRLAVCGDSAGGNLAAAVALMARDRGGPALRFQALVYPVTDVVEVADEAYPSRVENGTGYFLTTAAMRWYRDQYLADEADAADPYCSPVMATSLAGLPPAYVLTAEYDPLRDEGEHYGAQTGGRGRPCHGPPRARPLPRLLQPGRDPRAGQGRAGDPAAAPCGRPSTTPDPDAYLNVASDATFRNASVVRGG